MSRKHTTLRKSTVARTHHENTDHVKSHCRNFASMVFLFEKIYDAKKENHSHYCEMILF